MAELKEAPRPKTENGLGQTKEVAPRTMAAPMKSSGNAYAYMRRFAEEMDHLFENFGLQTGFRMPSFLTRSHELLRREAGFVPGQWSPHIDLVEKDGQLLVRADLPGLSKDDVKVDVMEDLITIQGERKSARKKTGMVTATTSAGMAVFIAPFRCRRAPTPRRRPRSFTTAFSKS